VRSSRGCARARALAPCAGRRPTALIQTYSNFGFGVSTWRDYCVCVTSTTTRLEGDSHDSHTGLFPKQSRVCHGGRNITALVRHGPTCVLFEST
jgi:hypothetical protein